MSQDDEEVTLPGFKKLDARALARQDQLTRGSVHVLNDLAVLDRFAAAPFPPGQSKSQRTFYSPVDDVHGALKYVLASARRSLILAMYGFDDEELADIVKDKLASPHIYVQLSFDSSQAGGVHEKTLLEKEKYPESSIAIGRSEKGAIMHLKSAVIDAAVHAHGSTNWSEGGESKQDNELIVTLDPTEAVLATTRLTAIHTWMLAHPPAHKGA